jgi:hypothetical protein
MHSFTELIDRSTSFTLGALKETEDQVIEALQTSAATRFVKTLQMIQLQKAIMAVGMFSIFESMIQDGLNCRDGFVEARKFLEAEGEDDLKKRFLYFDYAINVLKHGRGRSYDALLAAADDLPFRVKRPDENFFSEGDVSEVSTLIDVDDRFVLGCAEVIRDVSSVIAKVHPGAL